MSSRGRGYAGRGSYGGRGGYRGNSYRGNNPRGSYESRGRGGYNSHYNSHESRYNSGGGDRYNPGRNDRMDDSYKKPYRSESSNYGSRDYISRGGSPERKRMRMEGSSDRRSHDGGGHFGGSYGSRQDTYGERRSFGEERRRSPSREGYRKSGGMPPPRSPARISAPRSRVMRAPRRSFRGRTMRTRPSYRGSMRSRPSYYPRRFSERNYSRPYKHKILSSVKGVKGDSASSTEGEDWETEEKEEVADEAKESKMKSPKSETGDAALEEAEEGCDTDKEEGADGASDTDLPRSQYTGRKFISLYCVHCKEKCITFKGYTRHLMLTKHRMSMSAVARRHKAQLLRMRMAQRTAQRELEVDIDSELEQNSTFCLICKLHHRTTRHAHNLTDTHRAMKRFLLPYCRVCDIQFRSPMVYEHHICSLEHIKMKAYQIKRPTSPKVEEGSGDEGMDVDLDNFMTLDSVGDVDEVDDDDSGTEKKTEDEEKKIVTKKPKVEINIGSEHIKKVEVFWCELCKIYLRRVESGSAEEADVLRRHCRLRNHLGRYVRHRDTRTLRRHAERIHRQLQQQKEGAKEENAGEDKIDKNESESKKKPTENGNEELPASGEGEDKMWADVDKDIGELLREVDPSGAKSSDDEEDLVRYDKFRKSDKKVDGKAVADAAVAETEAGGDDDTPPAALATPV